jgi:hypothetical protein
VIRRFPMVSMALIVQMTGKPENSSEYRTADRRLLYSRYGETSGGSPPKWDIPKLQQSVLGRFTGGSS